MTQTSSNIGLDPMSQPLQAGQTEALQQRAEEMSSLLLHSKKAPRLHAAPQQGDWTMCMQLSHHAELLLLPGAGHSLPRSGPEHSNPSTGVQGKPDDKVQHFRVWCTHLQLGLGALALLQLAHRQELRLGGRRRRRQRQRHRRHAQVLRRPRRPACAADAAATSTPDIKHRTTQPSRVCPDCLSVRRCGFANGKPHERCSLHCIACALLRFDRRNGCVSCARCNSSCPSVRGQIRCRRQGARLPLEKQQHGFEHRLCGE